VSETLSIHPGNPRLFQYRGRPTVLLTATEHYGSVMNRAFDFEEYLDDAARHGMTVTRLFLLFRELQNPVNPYSTCKPESTDYISPFLRVGPARALDGQPLYDLDRDNPVFYDRLHRFMGLAQDRGIAVEAVLFSHTYGPEIWALNPLNPANHVNTDVEAIHWSEYTTCRHPGLLARQRSYLRRIVTELNPYDNVFFEVCNEPGGWFPGWNEAPSPEEVNQWMCTMAGDIRGIEASRPRRHLIAGQEAFAYRLPGEEQNLLDVYQFAGTSFDGMPFDVVNMHPLSNMRFRGRHYNLGRFMQAELHLRAFRDYCLDLSAEPRPLNLDEDNCASQYRDPRGWIIHRKRAWTALLCGAHYDVIDFSIIIGRPAGTPESREGLRRCFGHLSRLFHSLDLVHGRPLPHLIGSVPDPVCASAFGVPGEELLLYLADAREWGETSQGEEIDGALEIRLTPSCSVVRPSDGAISYAMPLEVESGTAVIELPRFADDLALYLRRQPR
jgi:hypothetical protein